MKKLSTFLLMMLALIITSGMNAEEFKKTFKEKYDVNNDALLTIDNRFGDVTCMNWNENAISIEVVITVDASSQKKIDFVLSKIDVDISGSKDKVSGVTSVGNMRGSNSFSIDYFIKMPKSLTVDLSNKYGDLIVEELEGSSTINVKYGNLIAQKLLNESNKIYLAYSDNNSIDYVKMANLSLSYSEIQIEQAEELDFKSKYNEIDIESVSYVNVSSGYDEYNIENVGVVIANSNFTEFEIESLQKKFQAEMDYGDLSIERIDNGFEKVAVTASYTDIELGFESGSSYSLLIDESYSSIDLPSESNIKRTEKSYTSSRYEGVVGGKKSSPGNVSIEIRHGSVNIE